MPALTQAMLDGSVTTPLVLAAGTWTFSSVLSLPTGARISGAGAVLQPSLVWADAAPALKAVSVSNIQISDIEIDGRGDERVGANTIAQLLLIDASSSVTLTDVTFRDGGVSDGAPSGPMLGIAARDALDDLTGSGVGSAIGSSSSITATRCHFIQSTGAVVAFGVRVLTDWDKARAPASFTHHCSDITFTDCEWDGRNGEMYWNMIEMAGGGTEDVTVTGGTFRGKCLSAIDFDKGCHDCSASDCTISDGGKPAREVGNASTRLAVINAHGVSSSYKTTDITVSDCTLSGFSSASDDVYESMLSASNCERVVFEDCTISDLNSSLVGYGILIDSGVNDVTFRRIVISSVAGGISTNLGVSGYEDIGIDDCLITATLAPIVLGASGSAGSQARLAITNTRATRTSATGGYIVNVTNVWAQAVFFGNAWSGTGDVSLAPTSSRAYATREAGEIVKMPAGTFTGHVVVRDEGCTLEGAGMGLTTITFDGTFAEGVRPGASVTRFTLKNCTLDAAGLSSVTAPIEVGGGIAEVILENVEIRGHTTGTIAIYNRGVFRGTGIRIVGSGGGIMHYTGATETTVRGCEIIGGQYGFVNVAAAGIDLRELSARFDYWAVPTYEAVTATAYASTYVDVSSHVTADRTSGDVIRYLAPVTTFTSTASLRSSSVQLYDRVETSTAWTQVLAIGPGGEAVLDEWRLLNSWRPTAPSGTATVYRVTLARLITYSGNRLMLQTGGVPVAPRWRTVTGATASTPSLGGGSRLDIVRTGGANNDTDTGGIHITETGVGAYLADCTVVGGRSDCITLRGTNTVAERCLTDLGYDMGFTVDGTNDRMTARQCTARRAGRSGFALLGGPSDLYSCSAYDNGTINDGSGDYGVTVAAAAADSTVQVRGSGNLDALVAGALSEATPGGFGPANPRKWRPPPWWKEYP